MIRPLDLSVPVDQAILREWVGSPMPKMYGKPLSARELEVIHRMTDGITGKECAADMGIRLQTVKNHLSSALAKTGCRNTLQLCVRYAVAGASSGLCQPRPTHQVSL